MGKWAATYWGFAVTIRMTPAKPLGIQPARPWSSPTLGRSWRCWLCLRPSVNSFNLTLEDGDGNVVWRETLWKNTRLQQFWRAKRSQSIRAGPRPTCRIGIGIKDTLRATWVCQTCRLIVLQPMLSCGRQDVAGLWYTMVQCRAISYMSLG
jgi:hypothetical protein